MRLSISACFHAGSPAALPDVSSGAREASAVSTAAGGGAEEGADLDELAQLIAHSGLGPDELQKVLASQPGMSAADVDAVIQTMAS